MAEVFLGTDLKIKVDLQCEGFSMVDDDFSVDIKCGKITRTYAKDNTAWVKDENDDYYLCLPTDGLSGLVSMVATLYVPDEDFADSNIRREVVKQDLFMVKKP